MLPYKVPLSNFDITALMNNEPRFGGVYMRDEVSDAPRDKSIIVNLDGAIGSGTHWVGLYRGAGYCYYFDSFGLPPPEEIVALCDKLFYSSNQIQKLDSIMCGYYAVVFLRQVMAGKKFYDFIYQFDAFPSDNNEVHIKRLASKLKG